MGFSRQEYYSGLLCPPPGDLLGPGIEPASLTSPAFAGRFFTATATCIYIGCTTWHVGSYSLTRDQTHAPYIGSMESFFFFLTFP